MCQPAFSPPAQHCSKLCCHAPNRPPSLLFQQCNRSGSTTPCPRGGEKKKGRVLLYPSSCSLFLNCLSCARVGPMPRCPVGLDRQVGGELRIGIFAIRDIAPGEYLSYDFQSVHCSLQCCPLSSKSLLHSSLKAGRNRLFGCFSASALSHIPTSLPLLCACAYVRFPLLSPPPLSAQVRPLQQDPRRVRRPLVPRHAGGRRHAPPQPSPARPASPPAPTNGVPTAQASRQGRGQA